MSTDMKYTSSPSFEVDVAHACSLYSLCSCLSARRPACKGGSLGLACAALVMVIFACSSNVYNLSAAPTSGNCKADQPDIAKEAKLATSLMPPALPVHLYKPKMLLMKCA